MIYDDQLIDDIYCFGMQQVHKITTLHCLPWFCTKPGAQDSGLLGAAGGLLGGVSGGQGGDRHSANSIYDHRVIWNLNPRLHIDFTKIYKWPGLRSRSIILKTFLRWEHFGWLDWSCSRGRPGDQPEKLGNCNKYNRWQRKVIVYVGTRDLSRFKRSLVTVT